MRHFLTTSCFWNFVNFGVAWCLSTIDTSTISGVENNPAWFSRGERGDGGERPQIKYSREGKEKGWLDNERSNPKAYYFIVRTILFKYVCRPIEALAW